MRLRDFLPIAILAVWLFAAAHVEAAWRFDETDDYAALGFDTALDLPDGDWTVAGWVRLTNGNAGDATKGLLVRAQNGESYWEISIGEASNPAPADRNEIWFYADNNGTSVHIMSTGDLFASNTSWTHFAARRSGNTYTLWVNGSQAASQNNAALGGLSATAGGEAGGRLFFGIFLPGVFEQPLDGDLGPAAAWGRALADAEIAGLADGFSAVCFPGWAWVVPNIRDDVELRHGMEVTRSGATVTENNRMIYCGG